MSNITVTKLTEFECMSYDELRKRRRISERKRRWYEDADSNFKFNDNSELYEKHIEHYTKVCQQIDMLSGLIDLEPTNKEENNA